MHVNNLVKVVNTNDISHGLHALLGRATVWIGDDH